MPTEALARPGVLDRTLYQGLFGIKRAAQDGRLTVPWPPQETQGFWERYLPRSASLAAVPARDAWRVLVPLRHASPVNVPAVDGASIWTEGFLHPWGATFVANLRISGEWTGFSDAAGRLLQLRRKQHFDLGGTGTGGIDDASAAGLSALRGLAQKAGEGQKGEGFSILTLMEADGDRKSFDPADEEVARFLHAVTSFSETWDQDTLPTLAEAKVAGKKTGPASHLIYGNRRGRTIWSPERFLQTNGAPPTSTLICHHRNLVLASVQAEALARFADSTADRLTTGTALSAEHSSQAGWTVRLLGDLYRGSNNTYRSGSPKAQIDQNGWLAPINAVRDKVVGLPPIA